ncbi:MAG: histidine kinase dimerization/phospho-acceptor domain-containing protein, partial [Candidatus Hinthialibacter sp.]
MKHGFLRRILARADKIDKEQIVDYMREIAQERDLLVLIFESMIEGMIVVDVDENVVYINQSARSILGLGDGPTVPDLPLKRVLDSPNLIQLCRECMKSGEPVLSRDFHLSLPEGERFLLINTIPLESSRQNLGSLFLFMDVTEQTEQERKLREAEKLAALTTLTAGMSHEIRNPLNSLSIHLQLLKRKLKKQGAVDDSTNETLGVLANEIKRLNGVIETFLAAVRPSKPE